MTSIGCGYGVQPDASWMLVARGVSSPLGRSGAPDPRIQRPFSAVSAVLEHGL